MQRLRWLIALQRAELLRDRSAAEGAVAYRAALPRAEALAAADPANVQAQRDLAINRSRLADALADAGDHAAALEQAQGALTIQRQLAAQDPANTSGRLDVANSEKVIGDVLMARGDPAQAVPHYREALDLREGLLAEDPLDDGFRREVAVSRATLGAAFEAIAGAATGEDAARQLAEAARWWGLSSDLWQDLVSRGALKPYDAELPADAAAGLARCQGSPEGAAGDP